MNEDWMNQAYPKESPWRIRSQNIWLDVCRPSYYVSGSFFRLHDRVDCIGYVYSRLDLSASYCGSSYRSISKCQSDKDGDQHGQGFVFPVFCIKRNCILSVLSVV